MKILQVINSMGSGGAEKLLLESLPLFYESHVKMDLLLFNGKETPFLIELRKKFKGKIYILSKTSSVYNPKLIYKLRPYLSEYDIIHVHLFPAQYFVAIAKSTMLNRRPKLIFTEHSISNRRLENGFFRKIDKHIYRFYDTIIAITSAIQDKIKEHTQKPLDKIVLIENGINLKAIKTALPIPKKNIHPSLSDDDILLMQVSGFRKGKDQATVIRSLQFLPKAYKLMLVGDGITRTEMEDLSKALQLEDRVLFLGIRMDVPQLLKSTDINILSSEWEGLSLSSIEGMASGKPFVASDAPGLREMVCGHGVLFPLGNDKALATSLEKLINDRIYYNQVVAQCQAKAERYDIDKMIKAHIDLYERLRKPNDL